MTRDQLIDYLTRLYPNVLKDLEESHEDSYQQAILYLLSACEKYNVSSDDEFCLLLHKCASFRYRRTVFNMNDRIRRAGITEFLAFEDQRDLLDPLYDTTRQKHDVMELLQLLPHAYRRVFYKLYVEGKEPIEVAKECGHGESQVYVMIRGGLHWIKDELHDMEGGKDASDSRGYR